jgi:hypothetical protein
MVIDVNNFQPTFFRLSVITLELILMNGLTNPEENISILTGQAEEEQRLLQHITSDPPND